MKHSLLLTVLVVTTVTTAVELAEDPPVAPPARAGTVRGMLGPVAQIKSVGLVSRVTGKPLGDAQPVARDGTFAFKNVPGDGRYDLCVTATDGRTYEGIDLDFIDARLLRLVSARRKQLRVAPQAKQAFTPGDVKWLKTFVAAQHTFTHIHRPLYIRGRDDGRAVVLVEAIRTKPFVASRGKMVWRVELWYFRKRYGGWEKVPNTERVLRRERLLPEAWRKIHVEYLPSLSVHVDARGVSRPVRFTLPKKVDPSRGRCPNTAPEIKTDPHVSGL